jgi:hypothetical protein
MTPLSQLAIFAKVIEQHGFSAAARSLCLTKSTVSKHVAALEKRLGGCLVDRTSQRIAPTKARCFPAASNHVQSRTSRKYSGPWLVMRERSRRAPTSRDLVPPASQWRRGGRTPVWGAQPPRRVRSFKTQGLTRRK